MKDYLLALWAKCCDYANNGYEFVASKAVSYYNTTKSFCIDTFWPILCMGWCVAKQYCVSMACIACCWVKSFCMSSCNVVSTTASKCLDYFSAFLAWAMSFIVSNDIENVMNATEGSVVLGFGKHEIQIQCDACPVKVRVVIQEPCDGSPVCQGGEANSIGVKILADGFILIADIKNNTCCVKWVCEF